MASRGRGGRGRVCRGRCESLLTLPQGRGRAKEGVVFLASTRCSRSRACLLSGLSSGADAGGGHSEQVKGAARGASARSGEARKREVKGEGPTGWLFSSRPKRRVARAMPRRRGAAGTSAVRARRGWTRCRNRAGAGRRARASRFEGRTSFLARVMCRTRGSSLRFQGGRVVGSGRALLGQGGAAFGGVR